MGQQPSPCGEDARTDGVAQLGGEKKVNSYSGKDGEESGENTTGCRKTIMDCHPFAVSSRLLTPFLVFLATDDSNSNLRQAFRLRLSNLLDGLGFNGL